MPRCRTERPELTDVGAGHWVACHLYTEPSREGLLLSQAQYEVSRLVAASADTVLTNARRFGLDPSTKLKDVPAELQELSVAISAPPAQEAADASVVPTEAAVEAATPDAGVVGASAPPAVTE
jgi:hypothetical protein